jgi:hypothetical protein
LTISCITDHDHYLRQKEAHDLADIMSSSEKIRRFFWGLGNEPDWENAFPLAKAILHIFGEKRFWEDWKLQAEDQNDVRWEKVLKQYVPALQIQFVMPSSYVVATK